MATPASRVSRKLRGVLKGPSESITISDLQGGLDQGASRWRMNPQRLKASVNLITDERPGVMMKRTGVIADTDATTGNTENLFNFVKSDGTETLVRSYHSGTNTYLEKRAADGTWSGCYYTEGGATVDVTVGTTLTQVSGSDDYTDWVKVGDYVATSSAATTFKVITSVTANTIVCSGGGLTNAAGQTFTVRKDFGNAVFLNFMLYKDHLWIASGTSNFLMAYNGTDLYENPNTWTGGLPARDSTLTSCPKAEVIALWGERIFVGSVSGTGGGSLLHYSSVSYEPANDPDGIVWNGLNEELVDINDGGSIRWLMPAHGGLYIFKDSREGMYLLSGNSPDDWVMQQVNRGQGTRFGRMIAIMPSGQFKGSLFWLGHDDFYAYNPSMVAPEQLAGERLRDALLTASKSIWRNNLYSWTTAAQFNNGTSTSVTVGTTGVGNDGSVVMDTAQDVDTTAAHFAAGTLTNTSSTKIADSVLLADHATTFYQNVQSTVGDGDIDGTITQLAHPFVSKAYRLLYPSVSIQLKRTGTPGGTAKLSLYSVDGSNNPLAVIEESATTFDIDADIGTSYAAKRFEFNTTLNPSTTYAFLLDTTGATLDASNKLHWAHNNTSTGLGRRQLKSGAWQNKGDHHDIRIFEYVDSGTTEWIGASVNTTIVTPAWGLLEATETLHGQTLTYYTRTGASQVACEAASWDLATLDAQIPSAAAQWIQVKVVFATTSSGDTPKLDDLTLNWSPSTATWESDERDVGISVGKWGAFSATSVPGVSGAVTYQIKFDDASPIGAGSGLATAYAAITPGQSIASLAIPPAVGDRYVQVKATFSSTDPSTSIPELFDAGVSWSEGQTPSKMPASVVWKDRIYLSYLYNDQTVPTGFGRYDKNDAWQSDDYGFNIAAWAVHQNDLYIGDTSNNISYLEFNSVNYNDRGAAITLNAETGSYDFGARDLVKSFRKFVLTGEKQSSGGNITLSYAIDQDIDNGTWTAITIDQSGTNKSELNKSIPFPFATYGKLIAFKIQQTGNNQSMAFTNLRVDADILPDTDSQL